MRPAQWTKNLLVFAAIIFSQNFFNVIMLLKVVVAFFLFCILSGSVYIINDLIDIEHDRRHPKKSKRPIASGMLKSPFAATTATVLVIISIVLSFFLNTSFGFVTSIYFLLQMAYSFWLRNIIILDVFAISAGFVLRAIGGAEVISVPISSWLLICTTLLALFLALSKRRHELTLLGSDASLHRKNLREYSNLLLDQMISVVTSSTVIAYALYTLSSETVSKFKTDSLKYTIPFVLFGILRYLYLIYQRNEGGSPERILLTDKPLIINIILYVLAVGLILYL
ncbi:MAG: decaprenyl-phosphate phosphoribosyltransferase [Nitrospirota bacterium]